MKKEAVKAFTARVTQASRSELTVILYEMTLTELKEAREAYEQGDMAVFDKELKLAQKYVTELQATLNYSYAISYELLSLYLYVNKEIVTAIVRKEPEPLDSAEQVLKTLLVGFEGVSRADQSGPVMRNTQQLYAGLTYGKGYLNETYVDPNDKNRGFMA
ncbi:flagellar protein FliS [Anaerotaenia torta]|uniref:flagellar export chaperone FliS n=1 Tax=Anaerotaenia torta TaxID=433293 RepID=UPI003D225E9D